MIDNLEEVVDRLDNLNDMERYREVQAEVRTLLDNNPQESALWVVKGNAEYGLGNFIQAADDFSRAIGLNPDDISARSNYALALYTLERYVDGLNACDSALYIDSTCAPAYINAAHCLEALGHGDLALEYLEKAIRKNEHDGDVIARIADIMSDYGYYEAAKNAFMQAARLGVPSDIHERIANFFADARSRGIERTRIHNDVMTWRNEFERHPDIFNLTAPLLSE